jgi:antitoxin MazE
MDLQVAKWANSLALRIPAEVVRQLGLREGATVEAQFTVDGALSIRPAQWNRKAFSLELTDGRNTMPMSAPVMEEMRSGAIDAQQAQGAWARFEHLVGADLRLLPFEPAPFPSRRRAGARSRKRTACRRSVAPGMRRRGGRDADGHPGRRPGAQRPAAQDQAGCATQYALTPLSSGSRMGNVVHTLRFGDGGRTSAVGHEPSFMTGRIFRVGYCL